MSLIDTKSNVPSQSKLVSQSKPQLRSEKLKDTSLELKLQELNGYLSQVGMFLSNQNLKF